MHAFDGKKVNGIIVKAVDKETEFVTLDGQTNKLPAGSLVIADETAQTAVTVTKRRLTQRTAKSPALDTFNF